MEASPLGTLPAELRLEIYKLVLVQGYHVELASPNGNLVHYDTPYQKRHLLATTATCRLVRQESLSTFYGMNKFYLLIGLRPRCRWDVTAARLHARDVSDFSDWVTKIGKENAASITSVTFELGLIDTTNGPFGQDHRDNLRANWWIAAQRGAKQLVQAGLSEECDISAYITLGYSETLFLSCLEERETVALQSYIGFMVPTNSREGAKAEVENGMAELRAKYEKHAHHPCEIGIMYDVMISDLEGGRAMLLDAITKQDGSEIGV